MSINSNKLLPKLIEGFGNIYECVNYVAKEARDLSQSHDVGLTESRAMTWILSGDQPEEALKEHLPPEKGARLMSIDDILWTVDDPQIRAAVTRSIFHSWRAHHLLYEYIDVSDTPRQARVRVLTRMLWYTLLITPRR